MAITEATYRNYADGPWDTEPTPGPLPQAHTRSFPTSRTYCTCGHAGPAHARQTLTTGQYSQHAPLRFRGDCSAVTRARFDHEEWVQCPCTWFVEDLERVEFEAKELKRVQKEKERAKKSKAKKRASAKVEPETAKRPKYYDKIVWKFDHEE